MLTEAPPRPRIRPAPHRAAAPPSSLLEAGRNVWRVATAPRVAVLSDGAAYFAAVREAMLNARHSIHIVGWDIDSRARLVGETPPEDGLPEELGAFLSALVERRPGLSVKLLLWDYSVLYALERELLPTLHLRWNVPEAVELCLDNKTPFGASHHQKIVVVDGQVAFSGGLDLTIRRWDRNAHDPSDPARVDPAGKPYPPFHDVQMMVDGEAAAALAEIVQTRWNRACGECLEPAGPASPGHDPWPHGVEPDLYDATIGIARTEPALNGKPEVREVEALYCDMIGAAERMIYVENQFLTSGRIARALIRRMKERPALETLIVAPKTHHTWLEHRTMLAGRIRFMRALRRAGLGDRVRLTFPHVANGGAESEVMVHSKVMVVDDRLLRIASSNLCNRSMGTDTECDLMVEARDAAQRAAVARIRDQLIAEHTGVTPGVVATRIQSTGSILRAVAGLSAGGKTLRDVEDGDDPARSILPMIEKAADPRRPIQSGEFLADYLGHPDVVPPSGRPWPLLARAAIMLAPVVLLILLWKATPVASYLTPEAMRAALTAGGSWGPAVSVGLFLLLGFVAFPVNVLILGTAAAFGTWPGLAYAAVGALLSAAATYGAGRKLGPSPLRRMFGPRINRVSQAVNRNGILTVTAIRLLPIAPFTLVNLVAGAMRIRFLDYMLGTALGLMPGIALLSLVGEGLSRILENPSPRNIGMLILVLGAWAGIIWGLQKLFRRMRRE
ncbi:VTT domain-containing protein [Roseomonas xinghualingensis]|uniref:VTT domain-containing protein n=1 Tax=Roseomonas xinghualingensis TaxID=2986475 RepID=UPI0021F190F1|nr:VTT domain-containing protein [Roseomonas sp. SXEYE001]MCV4208968.1 VTT domain-containing protein [Roseomonas sp. SXEYE001]